MPYDFYRHECDGASPTDGVSLPPGCTIEMWRPSTQGRKPAGFPAFPYGVWALFHSMRVFDTSDYRIALIRDAEGAVIHRSHVFPRWFRHPFMESRDLQVGDTFTEPEHRNKGLAEAALRFIVQALDGRTLWYVVDHENASSIRVAEKVGFRLVGRGERTKRLGIRLLGAFRMTERV